VCGITGFIERRAVGAAELEQRAGRMADTLAHRGPDDAGVWVDGQCGVALGHRRLSVIDISEHGHQPMRSPAGRYWIVYNGEVYNHAHLAADLGADGVRFSGHSDTEVLLAAMDKWGVRGAAQRAVGMFAFAAWDRETRKLYLGRDRMGEKPLYYGWSGGCFVFGSELKALRAHPEWRGDIDPKALTLYMRHNYVPAPHTIYRGIYKLPPACVFELAAGEEGGVGDFSPFPDGALARSRGPRHYWSFRQVVEQGRSSPAEGSDAQRLDELEELLRTSIRQKLVADVPVGALLSGGIDSSTVVALAQQESSRSVKTFSIGFAEAAYNEAGYAKAVAAHLGTEHTELYVSPREAMDVIPRLPSMYDEPFSDSSQIPTFLVSQLARSHVTVALSGDGGDELFGGYQRYFVGRELWRRIGWVPPALRRLAAALVARFPAPMVAEMIRFTAARLGVRLRNPTGRVENLVAVLASAGPEALYREMVSHWKDPQDVVVGGGEPPTPLTQADSWPAVGSFFERMMALDTVSYLPDDILTKVDRASMAVSLEARVPLLDHRIVEYAWRLPLDFKVHGRSSKWPLREILNRYVPRSLIERPKMGFAVPVGEWLRGPLRDWAEALLDPRTLEDAGFLRPAAIGQKWREHLGGGTDWQYYLWDVLMFQAWYANARG
jgi:asparagine synthase (glutamine-hydrolysing)